VRGKIPCPSKGKLKAEKGLVRLSIEIVAFTLNYNQIEGLQIWGQKGPVYLPAFIIYSFTKFISPTLFYRPFLPLVLSFFIFYNYFTFYTHIFTSPLYCPLLLSIFFTAPYFSLLILLLLIVIILLIFLKKERNNSNIVI
jgi:hypothetical protein